ncbi:MAG: HAD-IIB family hydrolase [Victivallales bacterium]|nr:HAD-IIB family hydrolase [Victivallales bacterium]
MPHKCKFSGKCKLIVSDIDFTFVGPDKAMLPRNLQAVEDAKKAGIPFAIATGRYWKGFRSFAKSLNLDFPQIADNGATIFDPIREQAMVSHPIGARTLELFYSSFKGDGMIPVIGTSYDYYSPGMDEETREILRLHNEFAIDMPEGDLSKLFDECVKISLYVNPPKIGELRATVAKAEAAARTKGFPFKGVFTEAGIYTANAANVSKLLGVKDLCSIIGCTPEDVLAVGDGDNDAEMLAGCGIGCAVANGTDAAKEAASMIVAACDKEGFADAVYSVL